ncbi:MAG: hypothetical protein L6R35_005878, partial [Caloplaca aegaea]
LDVTTMGLDSPIPLEIAGYTVFPLSLPPLPSFPVSATHYLFIRPHQPKLPTPAAARSLFLVNVPFDSTELHIKNILSIQIGLPHGRIEEVQFAGSRSTAPKVKDAAAKPSNGKPGKKRKRVYEDRAIEELEGTALPATWDRELRKDGLTAVAVFVDRPSMDAAFKAVRRIHKNSTAPVWGEGTEGHVPPLGSASMMLGFGLPRLPADLPGYINHHNLQYPDREQLLQSANTYMSEFAAREAEQARLKARKRQVPDDEGFITVTKGGRNGPARQESAQESAVKQKEKQKGLEDFYRFQHREKKKEKAAELMRRFEEDKEKVRKMKEKRGAFRRTSAGPYDAFKSESKRLAHRWPTQFFKHGRENLSGPLSDSEERPPLVDE